MTTQEAMAIAAAYATKARDIWEDGDLPDDTAAAHAAAAISLAHSQLAVVYLLEAQS